MRKSSRRERSPTASHPRPRPVCRHQSLRRRGDHGMGEEKKVKTRLDMLVTAGHLAEHPGKRSHQFLSQFLRTPLWATVSPARSNSLSQPTHSRGHRRAQWCGCLRRRSAATSCRPYAFSLAQVDLIGDTLHTAVNPAADKDGHSFRRLDSLTIEG